MTKLEEIESIEEELGIGITTLAKAYRNGIYIKGRNCLTGETYVIWAKVTGIESDKLSAISDNEFNAHNNRFDKEYEYGDYGKTWALTREELE